MGSTGRMFYLLDLYTNYSVVINLQMKTLCSWHCVCYWYRHQRYVR